MDKTLEIVVAAAVLMLIGAILFFMLSDSSGDFSDTTNNQISDSQCELWKAQGKCTKASQCDDWSQSDCMSDGGSCAEGQRWCYSISTCASSCP